MLEIDIFTAGVARQTNPTAKLNEQRVESTFDDVGRQLIRPIQVRDLLATAQATLTNGTSTVLLAAAGAGVFHDLVMVQFANASTVAAQVQLLDDGSVSKTFQVPASSTLVVNLEVPHKQNTANSQWNLDMEDITGTTITVDAVFSKEV